MRLHSQAAATKASRKNMPKYIGGKKNKMGNSTAIKMVAVMIRVINIGK